MGLVADQQLPQAFFPHRSDPTLGERVGIRRLKGRMNTGDAFRLEDGIEGCRELGVVVVDQEVNGGFPVFQFPDHLSGLLADPGGIRVRRTARKMHPPTAELDKEQHIDGLQK